MLGTWNEAAARAVCAPILPLRPEKEVVVCGAYVGGDVAADVVREYASTGFQDAKNHG